jgi:hypothetical protein
MTDSIKLVEHSNMGFSNKLVTCIPFKKGEVVGIVELDINASKSNEAHRYSVQIGKDEHISFSNSIFRFVNHSCDPCLFLDVKTLTFYALKDLTPNTELTFFYNSTEWEMKEPFICTCGAKTCLGVVKGAKFVESSVLKDYKLNNHIIKQLSNYNY